MIPKARRIPQNQSVTTTKPSIIGRYKVLGELGRGSMGIVYLAFDPVLKREVAIKLVQGGTIAPEEVLARFQLEAEISARLNHPNVITVFDVGKEQEFGPFMAMEYADGEVLSKVLARGPMAPDAAAMVLVQGFQALQAAHDMGIIHRDFKPENLILTKNGRLKLMDFGIARHDNPEITGSGVLCTPSFAAPEILDKKAPSAATDNWAFCLTAFQMLTGVLPFQTGSISSLLYAIAHEPPTFPSDLSPDLIPVFSRALEKEPAARYPNLRAFMLDLLAALPLDPEVHSRCLTLMETPEAAAEGATTRITRPEPKSWITPARAGWLALAAGLVLILGFWSVKALRIRTLTLDSHPPNAQVFLDDKPLGTTPLLEVRIPSKATRIRLEKEGYRPLEHPLRPEDRVLTLSMVTQSKALNFQSEPSGAEVFVNNVLMGITPIQGLQLPADRPLRLQLRKPGYEPWSKILPPQTEHLEKVSLKKVEAPKKPFWKRLLNRK